MAEVHIQSNMQFKKIRSTKKKVKIIFEMSLTKTTIVDFLY